jgi:hypothetical protein
MSAAGTVQGVHCRSRERAPIPGRPPEALVLRDGVAVFVAKGGVPVLFDHEGVSQVLGEPLQQPSA